MIVDLKKCAHCGGEAIINRDTYTKDNWETDYWMYNIQCKDCWISTPCYENQQDAIDIWQMRVLEKPDK